MTYVESVFRNSDEDRVLRTRYNAKELRMKSKLDGVRDVGKDEEEYMMEYL